MVVDEKKNGKWTICVNLTDLNKAYPKGLFPLPNIDSMVDTTTYHVILTLTVASTRFEQVQMEHSNQ